MSDASSTAAQAEEVPIHCALAVLRLEAAALARAADRFDERSYDAATALLTSRGGKLITTGAGTSGTIARKIAATFTSTGTPAVFLQPADALHGGLGVVGEGDVVIAVSNGGETAEILAMLPYLRARDVPVIAIAGSPHSTLATAADVTLDAAVEREACPLGLAPTSSTTVALAVGDALAVAVLEANGLTPERFAWNHPSGRLGRRLTLRVSDLTHARGAPPAVRPNAGFLDTLAAISGGGLGVTVVLDEDDILVGIITDGDVRRLLQHTGEKGVMEVTAASMMTTSPTTVAGSTLALEALRLMEDRPSQISVLPVVEERRCIGLIRVHDLVRAGI